MNTSLDGRVVPQAVYPAGGRPALRRTVFARPAARLPGVLLPRRAGGGLHICGICQGTPHTLALSVVHERVQRLPGGGVHFV